MQSKLFNNNYRDAIVAVHRGTATIRQSGAKYSVSIRKVRNAIEDLEALNSKRVKNGMKALQENKNQRQVYRWASKYANANFVEPCTMFEKKEALLHDATGSSIKTLWDEYGVSKTAHNCNQKKLCGILGYQNMRQL